MAANGLAARSNPKAGEVILGGTNRRNQRGGASNRHLQFCAMFWRHLGLPIQAKRHLKMILTSSTQSATEIQPHKGVKSMKSSHLLFATLVSLSGVAEAQTCTPVTNCEVISNSGTYCPTP